MAHQSLYRRFRPQRFGEVVGQPHLVRALRNAVRSDRVGHAYLLSGPRGTGKTSTARILAKVLNCPFAADNDGEPCGSCDSCVAFSGGTSLDLVELDAASNNSVSHIRDMTEKAALASAGRRKVYLLDEVHMLSAAASNALLKTLEEPPPHVVFILATTDPNKVLPTIRSRTQQFELSLVSAAEMAPHLRAVAEAAGASVDDAVINYVTERGGGSVRDALSALDTVLAAGGIPDDRADVDVLVQALANADLAGLLIAVSQATAAGVDARDLTERVARRLRDMFLVGAGVEPAELPPAEINSARELSEVMGRRGNVRALEALGEALAQMPQSADRRLTLETALVRLLADDVLGERAAAPTLPAQPAALREPPAALAGAQQTEAQGESLDRATQRASERDVSAEPAPAAGATAPSPASTSLAPATVSTTADLQRVWETHVVSQLRPVAAGIFRDATVLTHENNVVTVQLGAGAPVARAERRRNEIEAVLSALLDQTVRISVLDSSNDPQPPAAPVSAAETEAVLPSKPTPPAESAGSPQPSVSPTVSPSVSPTPHSQVEEAAQDEKVRLIMDRFPGSVLVHDEPGES